MRRFTDEMERWFEGGRSPEMSAGRSLWSPPIEVTERDGKFEVCAELPGLRKDDVKVELAPEGFAAYFGFRSMQLAEARHREGRAA